MNDWDDLQELVERLAGLLKDRHPGLVTWNLAVADALASIARWVPK